MTAIRFIEIRRRFSEHLSARFDRWFRQGDRALQTTLSGAFLALAFILWLVGLPLVDPTRLSDFGLIAILPWTIWLALALNLIGFVLSLGASKNDSVLLALHLVVLILLLHATPAITYGPMRYSWAWKHLGIIDYIQRHGSPDLTAPFLSANHNWPGFFVLFATITDLFGLKPVGLSHFAKFAPTVFNLLFLAALMPIFRSFTRDSRVVWVSALFFVVGNWVGQDYFSPQATAYLLYLVMLGLCLGPLAAAPSWAGEDRGAIGRAALRLYSFASRKVPEFGPVSAKRRMASAAAVLVIILLITVTHQFTPLVVIASLLSLAIIGRLSFGFALFAMIAEALWLLYFAETFVATELPNVIAQFGHTTNEVIGRLVDTSVVSPGQAWVSRASRGVTAAVVAIAVLGGVRRLMEGHRDGAAILLTLTAVPVLGATAYGGEAAFRIYLFALPSLAFFAAALFFPAERSAFPWSTRLLILVIGAGLAIGFILANNGKDRQYRFTPAEVSAAEWLYQHAPPHSLLVEGSSNYPSQFLNYENFTYVRIADENTESQRAIEADPVDVLGRWLDDPQWNAAYIIITRSQKAYVDDMGILPKGSLDRIERALLASPRFHLAYATRDAVIFTLDGAAMDMGSWAK